MSIYSNVIVGTQPVPLTGVQNWAVHAAMVGSTILLPMVAHSFGWPVLSLLPMFWGVLLAGIVYGWSGGLLAAIAAPLLNNAFTGMPVPAILPAMIVELIAYGTIPALLTRPRIGATTRDKRFSIPTPLALIVALVVGRLTLVLIWSFTVGSVAGIERFATTRLIPGIPVQLLQVILVPIIAEMIKKALRPSPSRAE